MKNKFLTTTTVLFMLITQNSFAQKPDLAGVQILTHPVADHIYMLEATKDVAGNIAVSVGPDGILLVDSQFPELADSILVALRKLHDGPIKYIINTHYHDDHTEGNAILGRNATIIGSHNTLKRFADRPKAGQPTITFDGEMSIHFNGEEIKLIHLPGGHTDTDVVVVFTKSKVVHTGDLFNAGISSFPNVDLEAGGTIMGLIEVVGKVIEMIPEDARIIPGHYELSNLADLKRCHQMLIDTIKFMKKKKDAGYTLEQIQKEGLPEKYANWGKIGYTSAKAWIENIFLGL